MKLIPCCLLLCLPAFLPAQSNTEVPPPSSYASQPSGQNLLNEQFDHGISAWTVDSGEAIAGRENNGTLILRSVKSKTPGGSNALGSVSRRLKGLTPGQNYELRVDFRFERDFANTWPWAMIAVYDDSGTSVIAEKRIADYMQSGGSGPKDSEWRRVTLPFNPDRATSVVIRLLNRASMLDQTHWDNITVVPLNP